MNDSTDAVTPAQMNGARPPLAANGTSHSVSQIVEALAAVHNPRSSNEGRHQASTFLEDARNNNEAPYHGFTLASDQNQPSVVRHYGLSLLEYAIRHRWTDYTQVQSAALREWVLELAQGTGEKDPSYIRNKVVQLWVDVAKRSWALDWMDMDELLVRLWNGPLVQKDLVLGILETLSEDIFVHEDPTAGLRGNDLNKACVEIFTPAAVLREHFPTRETTFNVRYEDDGWLARVGRLLVWCVENDVQNNERNRSSAIKALAVLRTAVGWAIPKAIIAASCVENISKSLAVQNIAVKMVRMILQPQCCESRSLIPCRHL